MAYVFPKAEGEKTILYINYFRNLHTSTGTTKNWKNELRETTNGWLLPETHPAFRCQTLCREGPLHTQTWAAGKHPANWDVLHHVTSNSNGWAATEARKWRTFEKQLLKDLVTRGSPGEEFNHKAIMINRFLEDACRVCPAQGVGSGKENAQWSVPELWHHKMAAAASCDVTYDKRFISSPDTVVLLPSISSIYQC